MNAINSIGSVIQTVQHNISTGFAKYDAIPTQIEDLTNRIAALETRPDSLGQELDLRFAQVCDKIEEVKKDQASGSMTFETKTKMVFYVTQ